MIWQVPCLMSRAKLRHLHISTSLPLPQQDDHRLLHSGAGARARDVTRRAALSVVTLLSRAQSEPGRHAGSMSRAHHSLTRQHPPSHRNLWQLPS